MKFGLTEKTYNKILELVEKYKEFSFVVFGSRARGDFKEGSDIDIAVYGDYSDKTKFNILNDFDLLEIPYLLDIVFVNEISKQEFLDSIKRDGVKFYE